MEIDFGDFNKTDISGVFLINPSWLEYLLDMFSQEYYMEFYEEIKKTQINHCDKIENTAFGIVNLLDFK